MLTERFYLFDVVNWVGSTPNPSMSVVSRLLAEPVWSHKWSAKLRFGDACKVKFLEMFHDFDELPLFIGAA